MAAEAPRMKRSGTVAEINADRGMVAVKTQGGGYTIFELIEDFSVASGDIITWPSGFGLGVETYTNETRGETADVYVQNHDVAQTSLRSQLRL
jgi:hypothetical protein